LTVLGDLPANKYLIDIHLIKLVGDWSSTLLGQSSYWENGQGTGS